jgi:hypothetical protein
LCGAPNDSRYNYRLAGLLKGEVDAVTLTEPGRAEVEDLRESRLAVWDPAPIPLDEMPRTCDWLKSWGMLEGIVSARELVDAELQSHAHQAAEWDAIGAEALRTRSDPPRSFQIKDLACQSVKAPSRLTSARWAFGRGVKPKSLRPDARSVEDRPPFFQPSPRVRRPVDCRPRSACYEAAQNHEVTDHIQSIVLTQDL